MGRIIRNSIAYIRGFLYRFKVFFNSGRTIGLKVRIFLSAAIDFDRGANVVIESGVKIRERVNLSVRRNATLIINSKASIGMDNKIVCHDRIVIGEGTLLSPNVLVYDHDHFFDKQIGVHRKEFLSEPIEIGKNCWIGANTVILKGTKLGDNCVVGAGSIIKGSFPSNTLIVQKRFTEISEVR